MHFSINVVYIFVCYKHLVSPLTPGYTLSVTAYSGLHTQCHLLLRVTHLVSPLTPGYTLGVTAYSVLHTQCHHLPGVTHLVSPLTPGYTLSVTTYPGLHTYCHHLPGVTHLVSPLTPGYTIVNSQWHCLSRVTYFVTLFYIDEVLYNCNFVLSGQLVKRDLLTGHVKYIYQATKYHIFN